MLTVIAPDLERVFRAARGTRELEAFAEALESCSDQRVQAFFSALQYVGVTEDAGTNADLDGHILRWQLAAGAKAGDPWCAAYACDTLPPGEPRIAGALNLLRRYPRIPASACHLLDLGGYATDDQGHGHVFHVIGHSPAIVEAAKVVRPELVMTLEGNAQNACRVQLRRAESCQFARTPFAIAGRMPPIIRAGVALVEVAALTR